MGTVRTFRELESKIVDLEGAFHSTNKKAIQAACLFTKKAVMMQLGSTGRPVIMSRVGRASSRGKHRIGVRYDIKTFGANTTAIVRAFGNMNWLENGTKPHFIPKAMNQRKMLKQGDWQKLQKEALFKGGKQKVRFKFPGDEFATGPIWHPGASPRRPWSIGIALAKKRTEDIFAQEMVSQIGKVF